MKLKNIIKKSKKYLFLLATLALLITSGIFIQKYDGSIIVSTEMLQMYEDLDTKNETADFNTIEKEEKGIVIEEKIAIHPIYIFSNISEIKYNTKEIAIKIEPKNDSEDYCTIKKGTELSILGYNDFGFAKIIMDGKELYVNTENLIDNKDSIFFECDYKMYTINETNIYSSIEFSDENYISNIEKYSNVNVIGENDSDYLHIRYEDKIGGVLKSDLNKTLPQEAFIELGNDGVTKFYTNNMHDGVMAEIPESEKTEKNLELLAKIIHCEAGVQTEAGKLAVGTVVVNRVYDKKMGTTIESVIRRPGQFQPVSSGRFDKCTYTESDYNAAKKVLYEGYRSFPAYVLYFQSIKEGYFAGQSTYCVCYTDNKTYPQYFSYKKTDLNKYKY